MRRYLQVLIFLFVLFGFLVPNAFAAETKVHRKTPRHQVELYVTDWCPFCKKAQAFFDQRGIPYQLYDIEKDSAALRRKMELDSGRGVPLALINGVKIKGWSQQAYEAALEK